MRTYSIEIGFAGFIGCSEVYEVDAETEEEAREEALQMAFEDLTIEGVNIED